MTLTRKNDGDGVGMGMAHAGMGWDGVVCSSPCQSLADTIDWTVRCDWLQVACYNLQLVSCKF